MTTRIRGIPALLPFLFVLAAFGLGCTAAETRRDALVHESAYLAYEAELYEENVPEPRALYLRYAVMPENPRPGDPVSIGVRRGLGVQAATLMVGETRVGNRALFFPVGSEEGDLTFEATVLTIPTTANSGRATIVLETAEGPAAEIPIEVFPREFRTETIRLNPVMAGIQADVSPERTRQAQHLWAVLGRVGDETHFFDYFVRPVESTRRTSPFGSRRVFVGEDGGRSTSIHAGIDYGVPTGTPVFSSGGGRVVLARDRIVSGKSVIVEHLPGVFTIFYHLDSILVDEGEMIAPGDVLGLSGSTGFSTGPHLHWELRVFGENTDPDAIVARPLLDRDALLSKLGY